MSSSDWSQPDWILCDGPDPSKGALVVGKPTVSAADGYLAFQNKQGKLLKIKGIGWKSEE